VFAPVERPGFAVLTCQLVVPLLIPAVSRDLPFAVNVTVPVALLGLTVALKVVVPLGPSTFGVAVTAMVVVTPTTVSGTVPVEEAKLESPTYVAVTVSEPITKSFVELTLTEAKVAVPLVSWTEPIGQLPT